MKIRVLHITWNLEVGGIQTWLLALARHYNRDRFILEFVVYEDCSVGLKAEIQKLGCEVHVLESRSSENLQSLFASRSYGVTHLHFCTSPNPLKIAESYNVPLRIFHNHNSLPAARKVYRQWWFEGGKDTVNARFSVSRRAALLKFGWKAFLPNYYQLQPAGIDLSPFYESYSRIEVKRELGIPDSCLVIGHTGRLTGFKNQQFLLEIVAHLKGDFRLLLIGEGPDHDFLVRRAKDLGIESHIIFYGNSSYVSRLLLGAVDIFVFPSKVGEGLPLALIEAQAAGLPCLVSDRVSPESIVVKRLVHWMSLRETPSQWAKRIQELMSVKGNQKEDLRSVELSRFNVKKTLDAMEDFYLERLSDGYIQKAIGDRVPLDFSRYGV